MAEARKTFKGKNDQPDQRPLKRGARGLSTDTGVRLVTLFFFLALEMSGDDKPHPAGFGGMC